MYIHTKCNVALPFGNSCMAGPAVLDFLVVCMTYSCSVALVSCQSNQSL